MKKILPYIACLLALASCVKPEWETPVDNGERQPISFETSAEATKADLTTASLKTAGWGLYGYYSGTSDYSTPDAAQGVIFNARQVRWDDTNSVWDYSLDASHQKEYWPLSTDEKVSFFAYAPYDVFSGHASVHATDGPQVTYTATTNMAAQQDLLWGTNTSGLPHRNVNRASYSNGTVDMHFRHAPAKIHFTINGATLGDTSGDPDLYTGSGAINTETTVNSDPTYGTSEADYVGRANLNGYDRDVYWAYRTSTVTIKKTYRRAVSGFKILLDKVDMTNFIKNGVLHLNNLDAFSPNWSVSGNETLNYSFTANEDLPLSISNPNNEATLSSGWGTTYLGVDSDPKELLLTPNNYIYMVPKQAVNPDPDSQNITITAFYHVIGLSQTVQYTTTTTTVYSQRVKYYTRSGGGKRYYSGSETTYSENYNEAQWENVTTEQTVEESAHTPVGDTSFNYSQDNSGRGFKAVGAINSDIVGGRNYTINLYLDGRELNLTVIPQPWDLYETTYDYNSFVNPVEQSLTYDSDYVYEVLDDNVYINNRMGKFYFRLGSGMYLYWQASLIGDDAFAFTDENGEYLLDDDGNYRTTVRGDLAGVTNYIYVKAINTSSKVTSKAKLRIYLFNSENHAVVALPRDNWLFVSATYTDGNGNTKRVQEWNVVQTAN